MSEPLLRLRDVDVAFDTPQGRLVAVRGVNLDLCAGETLAIVGESGSGKSALCRAILKLNQPPFTPNRTHVTGTIALCEGGNWVPLQATPEPGLRRVRARQIAMIAQESLSGLNPVLKIGTQIAEALSTAAPQLGAQAVRNAVLETIAAVGLPNPEAALERYPHQLSGGQRQRVMIAMSVIRKPRIIIADEPTTALDVTVQALILRLLGQLRAEAGMAMIFISHDLAVVSQIADRLAVMYAGEIVEIGPIARVLSAPRHPYTQALLNMRPENRGTAAFGTLPGHVPDPMTLPQGCAFRPRCLRALPACAAPQAWHGSFAEGQRCGRAQA